MNIVTESRYGKIIVNTNDKYVGRSLIKYGEFSEAECKLFRQIIQPNDVVIDVGANYGAHTIFFASIARHVFAFEPQKQVFNCLCGTLALNEIDNVEAFRVPVGTGEKVFYKELDFSVENNMGAYSFVDMVEGEEIPSFPLTIDCDFLKVDVEGMELQVLKGAEEMIRRCKPVLFVENDRPAKSDELIGFIESLGYNAYWFITPLFNPDNFLQDKEDIFTGLFSINMVCVDGILRGMIPAKEGKWEEHLFSFK